MAEQLANNASTTLNGTINNSTSSVVVTSAVGFPTSGDFRIIVGSEIMLVTAVSGTTFTVTRGVESTGATSHTTGAQVTHILTAGGLAQFVADNGGGPSLYTAPVLSDFSWTNQGSATATQIGDTVRLVDPSHNGLDLRILSKAAPSTPYRVEAAFNFLLDTAGDSAKIYTGLCFQGSGGEISIHAITSFTGAFMLWPGMALASPSSFGILANRRDRFSGPMPIWIAISDDGTTDRNCEISLNGTDWQVIFSEARTTDFTPTKVGFCMSNSDEGGTTLFDSELVLLSWREA